jgi:hypothetical protein
MTIRLTKKPEPKTLFKEIDHHIALQHWKSAIAAAREIGQEAIVSGKSRLALRSGAYLERLEDHAFAAHLLSAAGRMLHPSELPEWDGSSLAGRTLLIIQRIRHVGAALRLSRLIPFAARHATRCIVLAEPRLVPLFRRSFPEVDVRESGPEDHLIASQADVVASYETLMQFLASNEKGRIVALPPLKPDTNVVDQFRRTYGASPLIGICWHSTNKEKELPGLLHWANLIGALNATFVSVQYGDVRADIEEMQTSSGAHIICDDTVDSLSNLDRFAAQIAALDAVVTISNTGAHMAGALDVPMFVILDDKNHLVWPFVGRKTGWYSSANLIRKEKRDWPQVLAQVSSELNAQLRNR